MLKTFLYVFESKLFQLQVSETQLKFLSWKGFYADVTEKSSSSWLQAWLDLDVNFPSEITSLPLFTSHLVFLRCCLHSQICSPLLVEIWPSTSLSLFYRCFLAPVLPAKIPSLVLRPFPEPITVTRNRGLFIGQSWVACIPKGTDSGLCPIKTTNTEKGGSFPQEKWKNYY